MPKTNAGSTCLTIFSNELSKLQIQSEKNKISTDQTARDRDKVALTLLLKLHLECSDKQFSDLNKLEEQAGIKPADYNDSIKS